MYLAKDTLLAMCNYITLTHIGGIQINSPITTRIPIPTGRTPCSDVIKANKSRNRLKNIVYYLIVNI